MTNRTPVGTYRGPGMTEATFVRERTLDIVASGSGSTRRASATQPDPRGRDAVCVRPRSFGAADRLRLGRLRRLLRPHCGAETSRRRSVARRRPARGRRADGSASPHLVEMEAIGPFEEASIEVHADASAVVRAGVGSLGQGIETALAQIAADTLGLDHDRVDVRFHDTTTWPRASARTQAEARSWRATPSLPACEALLVAAAADRRPVAELVVSDGFTRRQEVDRPLLRW